MLQRLRNLLFVFLLGVGISASAGDFCSRSLTAGVTPPSAPKLTLSDLQELIYKAQPHPKTLEEARANFKLIADYSREAIHSNRPMSMYEADVVASLLFMRAQDLLDLADVPFKIGRSIRSENEAIFFEPHSREQGGPGWAAQMMENRDLNCSLSYDPYYLTFDESGAVFSPSEKTLSLSNRDILEFSLGSDYLLHEIKHATNHRCEATGRFRPFSGNTTAHSKQSLATDYPVQGDLYTNFQSHDEPEAYWISVRRTLKFLDLAIRYGKFEKVPELQTALKRNLAGALSVSSRNVRIFNTYLNRWKDVSPSFTFAKGLIKANLSIPGLPFQSTLSVREYSMDETFVAVLYKNFLERLTALGRAHLLYEEDAKFSMHMTQFSLLGHLDWKALPGHKNSHSVSLTVSPRIEFDVVNADLHQAVQDIRDRSNDLLQKLVAIRAFERQFRDLNVNNESDRESMLNLRRQMYSILISGN